MGTIFNAAVKRLALVALTGVGQAMLATPSCAQSAPSAPSTPSAQPAPGGKADEAALVEKGRYLAVAGDCMACHTAPQGGKPFAGGYRIESPLGAIVATNITPSRTAGIGDYTRDQFARAIRQGVRADGSHLYPAMPYTAYTLLSDDDTTALYTYFMKAVQPVDVAPPATTLPFPFDIRLSMAAWNLLFLDDARFKPDTSRTDEVNRGAYLVNALAHCSTCHTPRNVLMAERRGAFLGGSPVGAWYAPDITSGAGGIGGWSGAELAQYLKTGHVQGKGQAGGPMAEAVENSLQHLSDGDVNAIVAYLGVVPPVHDGEDAAPPYSHGQAFSSEDTLRGASGPNERGSPTGGAALFSGNCASCHQESGSGSEGQAYPALFHNTATGSTNPANLLAAILFGIDRTVGDKQVSMPRFDATSPINPLTDAQVSEIANYVLRQYGNSSVQVTPALVAQARAGGARPLLARIQPLFAPLAVAVPVVVFILIGWVVIARRRRRAAALA